MNSGNNSPLDLEAYCSRSSKLQKTFTTWVRVRINSDHCIELRSMRVCGDWLQICRASSMRTYYRVFFPLRGAFQAKKLELPLYAKFYVIWCRESKILCEDFWDRSRRIISTTIEPSSCRISSVVFSLPKKSSVVLPFFFVWNRFRRDCFCFPLVFTEVTQMIDAYLQKDRASGRRIQILHNWFVISLAGTTPYWICKETLWWLEFARPWYYWCQIAHQSSLQSCAQNQSKDAL